MNISRYSVKSLQSVFSNKSLLIFVCIYFVNISFFFCLKGKIQLKPSIFKHSFDSCFRRATDAWKKSTDNLKALLGTSLQFHRIPWEAVRFFIGVLWECGSREYRTPRGFDLWVYLSWPCYRNFYHYSQTEYPNSRIWDLGHVKREQKRYNLHWVNFVQSKHLASWFTGATSIPGRLARGQLPTSCHGNAILQNECHLLLYCQILKMKRLEENSEV